MVTMPKNPPWSEEELEVLKQMWNNPEIDLNDMDKVLKGRTRTAIQKKANVVGLKAYDLRRKSEINREYLKNLGIVIKG